MFSNDDRLDDLVSWEAPADLVRPEMRRNLVRPARGRRRRR
jgi:hypothetical protein